MVENTKTDLISGPASLTRHFSLDQNTLRKTDDPDTKKLTLEPDKVTDDIIAFLKGETDINPLEPGAS